MNKEQDKNKKPAQKDAKKDVDIGDLLAKEELVSFTNTTF
jgi:hypothetical protein